MTTPRTPVQDAIVQLLIDFGPMTCREIAESLGKKHRSMGETIAQMRLHHKIHIASWDVIRGRGGREAARYQAGTGTDAKKPVFSQSERQRRYKAKHKIRLNALNMLRRGHAAHINHWLQLAGMSQRSQILRSQKTP